MSTKYLGDEFDIHGGGLDLIFPHHECELAQAKAAGKPFARYWVHWNMLTLGGEKMAKSKGLVVVLDELFRDYDPLAIRFHLLRSHYRSVSDFSEESLLSSTQGLRRLQELYRQLRGRADGESPQADPLADYRERFTQAMNDDLNTPQAVAALFDAAREVNRTIEEGASPDYLAAARALFDDFFAAVLGLVPGAETEAAAADQEVLGGVLDLLLEQRHQARLRRDFEAADQIRDKLAELGVVVEDSAQGSRWKLD